MSNRCAHTKALAKSLAPVAVVAIAAFGVTVAAHAETTEGPAESVEVEEVVDLEVEENKRSAEIQARIDEIADDIDAMAEQYKSSLQNERQLQVYNRQLEGLIRAQEAEMVSLEEQISEATVINRQVMPHMEKMIAALAEFVEADLPFLMDERRKRIATLRELMGRADVTTSERFRRILEAFQIENQYGRTIESYEGRLEGDQGLTVAFLRIGRNALLYQTLDGEQTGFYNQDTGVWEIADDYRVHVREGIRIAKKERAPDLLQLPFPAAEVIQ